MVMLIKVLINCVQLFKRGFSSSGRASALQAEGDRFESDNLHHLQGNVMIHSPYNYTSKIAKSELEHGAYYAGRCRNASVARWDADKQKFLHWRTKFNETFLEEICHPEDDTMFDVFVVESKIDSPVKEIPLDKI